MDRPQLAQNPVGRIIYGITSLSTAFWRNVLKRNGIMFAKAFKRSGARGAAKVAWGFIPAAMALFGMQAIVSTLREYLLNRERWNDLERQGKLEDTMAQLAFTRSFSFGVADPFIQSYTGLKYQRDLSNVMVGPAAGVILQDMQNIIQPTIRNSDKTNTSEYNATRSGYNLLVGPAVSMGLSTLPVGPLGSPIAGFGQAYVTSPAAGSAFATAVQGPKGMKTDPETGELIETQQEYEDRMRAKKDRRAAREAAKEAGN